MEDFMFHSPFGLILFFVIMAILWNVLKKKR